MNRKNKGGILGDQKRKVRRGMEKEKREEEGEEKKREKIKVGNSVLLFSSRVSYGRKNGQRRIDGVDRSPLSFISSLSLFSYIIEAMKGEALPDTYHSYHR